jgi:hypothetical protein
MKRSVTQLSAIMERTKPMAVVLLLLLATSIPQAMGAEGNIRGLQTRENAIQMWAERVNTREGAPASDEKVAEKVERARAESYGRERETVKPEISEPEPDVELQDPLPREPPQSRIGLTSVPCGLNDVSNRHCSHYRVMELNQNYNPNSLDKPACRSTSSASFGSFSTESGVIEFVYEMEVDLNNADNVVFGKVVPMIERALTDSLLPVFFEDDCADYNPQVAISRRRLLEGSSGVMGVSGIPYDTEKTGTFLYRL